jgi:endonuclease/exonuclease/phosphatase family metal-dependent hydrolase
MKNQLKICQYNLENLFIFMDLYQGEDLHSLSEEAWKQVALAQFQNKQKPLYKIFGLAKAIQDIDPDILLCCEVGGQECLENFNKYFLNNEFDVYFMEGNSIRNINLGFLVKKELHCRIEVKTNKNTKVQINDYQKVYNGRLSRDVAELQLIDGKTSKISLILLLTHLKSKISTDRDYKGNSIRAGEVKALTSIYENLRSKYPNVPIIVGGDFNSNIDCPEFSSLNSSDLIDPFIALNKQFDERVSLVHFNYEEEPEPNILDYLLISPHLSDKIDGNETYTYRYRGFYDIPNELPKTLKERWCMPSDHYPIVLTINHFISRHKRNHNE